MMFGLFHQINSRVNSPAGSSNRTLRPLILFHVLFIPLTAPIPTHTVTKPCRALATSHDLGVGVVNADLGMKDSATGKPRAEGVK
jgi:hypothetical protein